MAMAQDITRLRIGASSVGVVGLRLALEQAARDGLPADEATARQLLERLRSENFVAPEAESEYLEAVLLEYRKLRGEAVAPAAHAGLEVRILGPGCPRCEALERMVREVLAEQGLDADVDHVRDLEAIAGYGLVATPGLVVNGEVKSAGRLPRRQELLAWLGAGSSARPLPTTGS